MATFYNAYPLFASTAEDRKLLLFVCFFIGIISLLQFLYQSLSNEIFTLPLVKNPKILDILWKTQTDLF